ncbi:MAG: NADH-quinone oxidoreductase subunit N [Actinobacteria bacterium]|nr:NADH-quinone oxidoreductase subunit N [Actinomycetota bacterium]
MVAALVAQAGAATSTIPSLSGAPAASAVTTAVPGTDPNAINTIATPPIDWSAIMPMVVLFAGAVLLITVTSLMRRKPKGFYAAWTIITVLIAMATAVPLWARVQGWTDIAGQTAFLGLEYQPPFFGPFSAVAGAVGVDGFTIFATFVICISVALGALAADSYLRREGLEGPEFYVLMLISAAGGVLLASSNDLIALFLGLETMSIAVYVMAAMHLKRVQSQEAGMKYFVLGAFSSAFLLYGIAMLYGATGTTNLIGMKNVLSATIPLNNALLMLGFGFVLVGLGFKVSAVPFHSWSPDVYDGAPTPAVVYMASGVKVAAFAGMVRVFVVAFGQYAADWQPIVYALAVLSLAGGAVLGAVQTNVKRMLAYSSISHAGFLLMAVEASNGVGTSALLFYLAVYVFMVAGAFGVAALVGRQGDGRHSLDDYRGLGRTNPLLSASLVVFLLAQAGVPFTSGFLAKFYAIGAAVSAGSTYLAVVAVISSVIAAFIYLRIIVAMYMSEGGDGGAELRPTPEDHIRVPATAGFGIALCVLVTIGFGLFPDTLTRLSEQATPALVEEVTPPGSGQATAGGPTGPIAVDPTGGGSPGGATGAPAGGPGG